MHSNDILDYVANLLVCHVVFVGNIQKSPIAASHLSYILAQLLLSLTKLLFFVLCFTFPSLLFIILII